ncbi:MAG: pilus assembly protein, partial [Clostridiales bacterium]
MNKRGSAMVWAVISMTVVLLIVTGVVTLSNAYAKRSIDENAGRQAYLTARSMVDVVLSKIDGYHEDFPAGSSSFRYHNTLIPAIGDRVPL